MDSNSRVPEPVQWWEGMTLAPQHFQQSDLYWHARLQHRIAHLDPHSWGVIDLELDDAAISAGKILIRRLHAVMPDGLLVQYPALDESSVLELDISSEPALRENKAVLVQLAVPVRTAGAASRASSIQRYDSVAGALEPDENTGAGAIAVGRLRARLTLLSGDSLPAKYVGLPLFKVRRDIGGHFSLADYHPPMLRMAASAFLGSASLQAQLEYLALRIRSKARELAGAADDATPGITNNYQRDLVRQLVPALPELEMLARMPTAHPFHCYVALARMAGHVAGVSGDPLPMLLDAYRHEDCAPGFLRAIHHLSSVIGALQSAYTVIAFERQAEGVFTCVLPLSLRTDRLIVEIKTANGQSAVGAEQWLRQACIGSAAMIPVLRQRRLPGARVRPLADADLASLGARGTGFYELVNQAIQNGDKLAPAIQRNTVLHVEGPSGAGAPAAIVLYVPTRAAQAEEGADHE